MLPITIELNWVVLGLLSLAAAMLGFTIYMLGFYTGIEVGKSQAVSKFTDRQRGLKKLADDLQFTPSPLFYDCLRCGQLVDKPGRVFHLECWQQVEAENLSSGEKP